MEKAMSIILNAFHLQKKVAVCKLACDKPKPHLEIGYLKLNRQKGVGDHY